ncbi:MAG: hypothetical protein JO119_21380 [Acidobacteria bacterium]|nr:hypothetical protein [Acidobacteriota bacterium]
MRRRAEYRPRLLLRSRRFLTVVFGVEFGGFASMMGCVLCVTVSRVGMMRCSFMIPGFVVLTSLTVMSCCVFVVLCCFVVVFGSFFGHIFSF